jgi:putative transposase
MQLSKSMYYYNSCKDDTAVIDKLTELAEKYPRRGCDKFYDMIRGQGLNWNYKRIRRVYKLLKLNMKRKIKRRLPARVKSPLLVPEEINRSWSMDFMSDALCSGRKIRVLNIMDEYNREALAVEVSTSFPSQAVMRILEDVIEWRGKPDQIRVDNGPEFTSTAFINWCKNSQIRLHYIQPGKPMQNGFIERFNRTFREEVLDAYLFQDIVQVRDICTEWMEDYNYIRPHESLEGRSPKRYKEFEFNCG